MLSLPRRSQPVRWVPRTCRTKTIPQRPKLRCASVTRSASSLPLHGRSRASISASELSPSASQPRAEPNVSTPRPRGRRDRRGLADGSSVPHLLCTAHAVRRGRQLQHRCVLAFIEPSDQHDLSIREFERIVMHVRFVRVHLPKAGYLVANCLFTLPP